MLQGPVQQAGEACDGFNSTAEMGRHRRNASPVVTFTYCHFLCASFLSGDTFCVSVAGWHVSFATFYLSSVSCHLPLASISSREMCPTFAGRLPHTKKIRRATYHNILYYHMNPWCEKSMHEQNHWKKDFFIWRFTLEPCRPKICLRQKQKRFWPVLGAQQPLSIAAANMLRKDTFHFLSRRLL